MSQDISQLAADIPAISKVIGVRVETIMRQVALNADRLFTDATPVDTGYAQANWRLSVGQPDTTVSVPPDYLKKRGGGVFATKAKGWYPKPSRSGAELNDITVPGSVFVTNSVHYMKYLEEGSSIQAPAHFVKIIIQRLTDKLHEFVEQARKLNK